jgi:pimeloyl-ACP methyl ester carboxylesterase
VGDHDQPECIETAERLSRHMPNARLERMAGTAHAPSMERPEAFDALVLPFLEQHA